MRDQIEAVGGRMLTRIRDSIGPLWEGISDQDQEAIKRLSLRMVELQLQAATGQDVTPHLRRVEGALKQWAGSAAGAGEVARIKLRSAVLQGLEEAAGVLAGVLMGAASRLGG